MSATTVAAPLTDLASGAITGSTVELSWTAAVGASSVTVEVSTNGGSSWKPATVETAISANASTAKVTGLLAGTDYKLRLNVTGGENNGLSNVLAIKTANEVVTSLAVTGKSANTVALSWSSLIRASSVSVEFRTTGGEWQPASAGALSSSSKTATVRGLQANTEYEIRLKVVGGANEGASYPVSVKTDALKLTSLSNTGKTSSSVTLKWTVPARAASFGILISTNGGVSWGVVEYPELGLDSTSATITGLSAYTSYKFKLAISGGDYEGESNEITVRTTRA
ncbi:fibronectin type III domain-containing protein [Cohnella faecalis]|uniref:Fibronectin type-III domain-containing protein n=1 Tax=Cohnella faecalis TaxID=2315694 RepID=A0A398CSU4_9BACL|nr:fibronectin type III domain-containing protein [Cohnella faecalis]RIE02034.1 hypothetical protein D3H35_14820 [Cohnella faecalis]